MPRTKNASTAIATVARQIEKLKNANMQVGNDDLSDVSNKPSNKKKNDKKPKDDKKPKGDKKTKDVHEIEKRPKTEYQKFFTEKLAEIRKFHEDNGTQCPVYKEIRTQIVDLWNKMDKPSKTGKNTGTKKKDTETTRKPTAYNLFVKEMMPLLKKEHDNDDKKLAQKDYMKLIGEKWREHKAAKNIN